MSSVLDTSFSIGNGPGGEGILPSHAPAGAFLGPQAATICKCPFGRALRRVGGRDALPPKGPDLEPGHQQINALRDLFNVGENAFLAEGVVRGGLLL